MYVVFIPSLYTLSKDKYVSEHINTSHSFTPIDHYLHLQTLQKNYHSNQICDHYNIKATPSRKIYCSKILP